jgi:hypothetical protein
VPAAIADRFAATSKTPAAAVKIPAQARPWVIDIIILRNLERRLLAGTLGRGHDRNWSLRSKGSWTIKMSP